MRSGHLSTSQTIMQSFDLYDELMKQQVDLSKVDWSYYANAAAKLPAESTELLYALIYHAALKHGTANATRLPFSGQFLAGKKGAKFSVAKLPDDVKKLIVVFINRSVE